MLRKIFVTITLTLLLIASILYNGWNLFNINASLSHLLESRIRSEVGDGIDFERLSFHFGSLNLAGVTVRLENAPYQIQVDEIRLGYSIASILRNGINPERTADNITIYKPRVTLLYNPTDLGAKRRTHLAR